MRGNGISPSGQASWFGDSAYHICGFLPTRSLGKVGAIFPVMSIEDRKPVLEAGGEGKVKEKK